MFGHFRGKGYKARLLNPRDAIWDWRLGIQTFGFYPAIGNPDDFDWRVHYTPTPYNDIFRILRMVDLGHDDVFVDLGAGMGRAVFAASWLGARRAVGVEVVQDLCDTAMKNHQRGRLADRDIRFICMNARDYDNSETSVLFMFHPFGEATLRQVVRNLEMTYVKGRGRPLRIIYVNPIYDTVLQESKWLKCIGRAPARSSWFSSANHYDTSIWQAC